MNPSPSFLIRNALPSDLPAITRIYNHAIVTSVATFDLEPFAPEDRRDWLAGSCAENPMLVCEIDGAVAGYAGYMPFRAKPAYDRTKETTIYVDPTYHGRGVGAALYSELIDRARRAGVHVLIGVLGGKNLASEALHRKFGFELAGCFREVGFKFGEWVDTYTFVKIL